MLGVVGAFIVQTEFHAAAFRLSFYEPCNDQATTATGLRSFFFKPLCRSNDVN